MATVTEPLKNSTRGENYWYFQINKIGDGIFNIKDLARCEASVCGSNNFKIEGEYVQNFNSTKIFMYDWQKPVGWHIS